MVGFSNHIRLARLKPHWWVLRNCFVRDKWAVGMDSWNALQSMCATSYIRYLVGFMYSDQNPWHTHTHNTHTHTQYAHTHTIHTHAHTHTHIPTPPRRSFSVWSRVSLQWYLPKHCVYVFDADGNHTWSKHTSSSTGVHPHRDSEGLHSKRIAWFMFKWDLQLKLTFSCITAASRPLSVCCMGCLLIAIRPALTFTHCRPKLWYTRVH